MTRTPGFNTLAVHAGAKPDPATGARATPIYQTTAFVFEDADHAAALFNLQVFGNIYSRIMNPTNAVLEERVAALENGRAALSCGSGHAAQLLALHTLMGPGDNIVAARQLYGGSINQFSQGFAKFDWHVKWADTTNPGSFKAQIDDRTKAVFIESIANPGGIISGVTVREAAKPGWALMRAGNPRPLGAIPGSGERSTVVGNGPAEKAGDAERVTTVGDDVPALGTFTRGITAVEMVKSRTSGNPTCEARSPWRALPRRPRSCRQVSVPIPVPL